MGPADVAGLWELCDFGSDAGLGRSGTAGRVNDVADFSEIIQGDGNHVMEFERLRTAGTSMARGERDAGMTEDGVDAEAPGFVGGNAAGHFVRGPKPLVPAGAGSSSPGRPGRMESQTDRKYVRPPLPFHSTGNC